MKCLLPAFERAWTFHQPDMQVIHCQIIVSQRRQITVDPAAVELPEKACRRRVKIFEMAYITAKETPKVTRTVAALPINWLTNWVAPPPYSRPVTTVVMKMVGTRLHRPCAALDGRRSRGARTDGLPPGLGPVRRSAYSAGGEALTHQDQVPGAKSLIATSGSRPSIASATDLAAIGPALKPSQGNRLSQKPGNSRDLAQDRTPVVGAVDDRGPDRSSCALAQRRDRPDRGLEVGTDRIGSMAGRPVPGSSLAG